MIGVGAEPLAGTAPACFHFGKVEPAVAVAADLLGAVPFQEVVGGAADARGGLEREEAMLAAIFLVVEGPAEAGDGEDGGEEGLADVEREGELGVERLAEVDADEEGEQEHERGLQEEEDLAAQDGEGAVGVVDVAARGGGEGDEDDQGGFEQETAPGRGELEGKLLVAAGEEKRDDGGEQAKRREGCDAESCGAFERALRRFGAQPEGVAGEAEGEGCGGPGAGAPGVMEVPEFGVPGAEPVLAVGRGHGELDAPEEHAVEAG